MKSSTRSIFFAALAALTSTACGSSGCSNLETTPGGFPAAKRTANAAQVRISSTGIDKVEAAPLLFAKTAFGPSGQMKVSPSCGSGLCCPGGTPSAVCGSISFDMATQVGDAPRLVVAPVEGNSRFDVTVRARVKTVADIPINVAGANCGLRIDSTLGALPDLKIDIQVSLFQDATTSTTRLNVANVAISQFTTDDVALIGGIACQIATLNIGSMVGILQDTFASTITDNINAAACKRCADGVVTSCGQFATACTAGVCMINDRCEQEIGPSGRLSARAFFHGAPPGGGGAMDVYEVAGGYGTTNQGGAALGILGGLLPGGSPHDRCGPPATEPAPVTVLQSTTFQGNTRPDNGQAFDFALGLHVSQAEQLAYAAYEGGVLCATVDTQTLPTLTSNSLLAVAPSLDNLTRGDRPVWVGFRPQSPPVVTYGANTFTAGAVTDPLVTLAFSKAEMDVFAQVERQPIRVATIVADMTVPLGAKSDAPGTLTLVAGTLPAPANVSAKNHAALLEGDALASLAPALQNALVPELVRRVNPIPLPGVVGLAVTPTAITTVESKAFIAVFGDLAPPPDAGATAFLPGNPSSPSSGAAPGGSTSTPIPGPQSPWFLAFGVLAFIGIGVLARRRPRHAWGASVLFVATASLFGPASCGGDDEATASSGSSSGTSSSGGDGTDGGDAAVACVPAPCQAGELAPNLGAWNSVATSAARTVIATYDDAFGDAVLVELAGANQTRHVIDGVPNDPPTHAPTTYRGGVSAPGPNVGAWPTVVLIGDRAHVAYQDRDRGALRFAIEDASGRFAAHDVDAPAAGVQAGAHASLANGATPAIAYVVTGLPGDNGAKKSELRFARAKSANPMQTSDWTNTVVASSAILHTRLLALGDGRFVIVYYDSARTALVAAVENASGAGQFTEVVLDGADANDRGAWAAAVLDASGVIHVAYTDAVTHQVLALDFTPGSAPSAPELVDDGVRTGDRAHWVGAGLTAWLDGATFRVAYQDAMTADVVVATRGQGTWSYADFATGPALDGFALATPPSGRGPVVWDRLDPKSATSHALTIQTPP